MMQACINKITFIVYPLLFYALLVTEKLDISNNMLAKYYCLNVKIPFNLLFVVFMPLFVKPQKPDNTIIYLRKLK